MKLILASERLPDKSGSYWCMDKKFNQKKVISFSTNKLRGSRGSLFYTRPFDIEWLDDECHDEYNNFIDAFNIKTESVLAIKGVASKEIIGINNEIFKELNSEYEIVKKCL